MIQKLSIPLILLGVVLLSVNCYGLNDKWKATLKQNVEIVQAKNTLYVWGAAGEESGGIQKFDCSGYVHWVYFKSGIPVKRTVAFRMRHGMDGWIGKDIELDDVEEMDLPFWSWKDQPTRPFGHIGIFVTGIKSNLLEVRHASGTKKKVVQHQLQGVFLRDLSAIRRVTIGEKQEIKLGPGVIRVKPGEK